MAHECNTPVWNLLPFSCCAFKPNGRVTIWDRTRLCPLPYDVITFLKQNSTRVIDQTDHAHFFHVWTCMGSSCRNVQPTGPTHDLLPAARPVLVKMSQAFFGRPRSKSVWSSQHFTDVMSNVPWSRGVLWWHPARLTNSELKASWRSYEWPTNPQKMIYLHNLNVAYQHVTSSLSII